MFRRFGRESVGVVAALAVLGVMAGWVLWGGVEKGLEQSRVPKGTLRHSTGSPQLVSVQPLPDIAGEICQWTPVSASTSLVAALRQERLAARAASSAEPDEARREQVARRKPVRTIHDPYAAYSAVAVDPIRDEVVLTDENLFNILVYDRRANTPPTAKMTEPKRMIGGLNTMVEFQCGLYIDPASGDIYAVNNDTKDTLVIFNRQAQGNVPPSRTLETPHGTFGIAVDELAQEMYLAVQQGNAVVVYRKNAENEEAPIRLLQGNRTLLADPHGIALDTKNKLLFVSNYGSFRESQPGERAERTNWPVSGVVAGSGQFLPPSITVYPMKASGDTPPLRVIQGAKTQMNWPTGLAVDSERGELYVANDMGDSILVFGTSASGDVAPGRVLKGPQTLLRNPTGVALDSKNDEFWVSNFGNHTATVYSRGAAGDTPPLRVIRSGPLEEPSLGIGNPHPVTYDSKREEILVPN